MTRVSSYGSRTFDPIWTIHYTCYSATGCGMMADTSAGLRLGIWIQGVRRLPMGIGLVFFPRRTPIRAVMEAGRAMLNMLQSKPEEEWKVNDLKRQTNAIDLTFNNSISFSYKTSYGKDSEIPDIWHLCCFDSEGKAKQLNELTTSL